MSDLPEDLDLKFLPDWLKEAPTVNRYADFQGETEYRGDRGSRSPRGDRGPGGDRGQRGPRPPQGRRGPGGGLGSGPGQRPQERRGGPPPRGDRRQGGPQQGGGGGGGGGGRRPWDRDREHAPRPEPVKPAAVRVEFIPEPNALAAIAKQIRHGARAYPLFGTARLFLDKPERYRVRITATEPDVTFFQLADGPITFDRTAVERDAFRIMKADYYREEVVQTDAPKGNFSNVARVRATGALIGPTNHHGYQPALRKIYEERFRRRMSFPEFQQQEIQVITDEQAINDWKEQARSTTTYVTTQEAEPVIFKTPADAEQHFRKTYLPTLLKIGATLETSGLALRDAGDRSLHAALRDAWERERGFPGSLVNHLRPAFVDAGLHFFKHRKRVIYISPIRPQRHNLEGPVSDGIATILNAVEAAPRCSRHDLAVKLLGEHVEAPENVEKKTALAADLHYLVHAGHVIEFADRTLDLPLPLKSLEGPDSTAADEKKATPQPAPKVPQVAEPAAVAAVHEPESAPVEAPAPEPTFVQDAPAETSPIVAAETVAEAELASVEAAEPEEPTPTVSVGGSADQAPDQVLPSNDPE